MKPGKGLALTFATVPMIGSMVAAFFVLIMGEHAAVVFAAVATFALALLVVVLLAGNRTYGAVRVFALHGVGAFVLYVWAVSVSAHDGKLFVIAVVCEACGVLGVAARPRPAARRRPMEVGKAFALMLSTVPMIGSALVVLLLWFLATFPFENSEPATASETLIIGLLIATAVAALVSAVLVIIFLAGDRDRAAVGAFGAHATGALVLLAWAISVSEHSDGTVFAFALACEVCGVLAVLVGRGAAANGEPEVNGA